MTTGMDSHVQQGRQLRRIRTWLAIFITGLVLSGLTAFPLATELRLLVSTLHSAWIAPIAQSTGLLEWIERVNKAVAATNASYPFLAYGADWLAFAHLAIAVAFIGPYLDPVRNKWVITFGLIACQARGIPFACRLVDCSFGVLGSVPLPICRGAIAAIERAMP